jgi:hypothetical protein
MMADGSLNSCKDCRRTYTRNHRLKNESVREYDRQRSKTPNRREHLKASADRWDQQHTAAYRAHNIANNAVRDGKLAKRPCQICGTLEHVHKHHRDYSAPLDVTWLCARCHCRVHVLFPEISGHR